MSSRRLIRHLLIICYFCLAITTPIQANDASALRVGTTSQYPPFSFEKQGQLHGLDIDLARLFGEQSGRTIEFRVMPFDQLIPALQSDSIDVIMSGMSITPERTKQLNFTSPIAATGQMAIIHQRNIGLLGELRQLSRSGRRIGVKQGTTGEQLVIEQYPNAIMMKFSTVNLALAALAGGELDYVIHDAQTSWLISNREEFSDLISLNQLLSHEEIAWALSSRKILLRQQLNEFLNTIGRDGTLDHFLRRWTPLMVNTNQ